MDKKQEKRPQKFSGDIEKDIKAVHTLETGDGVADNGGIAVAEVPVAAWVIDRRSDVKFFFHKDLTNPDGAKSVKDDNFDNIVYHF